LSRPYFARLSGPDVFLWDLPVFGLIVPDEAANKPRIADFYELDAVDPDGQGRGVVEVEPRLVGAEPMGDLPEDLGPLGDLSR
jgi:hypothetical protein